MSTKIVDPAGTTEGRQPVSDAVIEAVAVRTDTDPLNLPPLYGTIDPGALNALFSPTTTHVRTGTIVFTYHDTTVTVVAENDGTIAVEATERHSPDQRELVF